MMKAYQDSILGGVSGDALVFRSPDRMYATIERMLYEIGIKTAGDYRNAHTFRHYCATKLFYDGEMRIEDIACLLGDEVSTIRAHYLHPTPRMLRKRVPLAMRWPCE